MWDERCTEIDTINSYYTYTLHVLQPGFSYSLSVAFGSRVPKICQVTLAWVGDACPHGVVGTISPIDCHPQISKHTVTTSMISWHIDMTWWHRRCMTSKQRTVVTCSDRQLPHVATRIHLVTLCFKHQTIKSPHVTSIPWIPGQVGTEGPC